MFKKYKINKNNKKDEKFSVTSKHLNLKSDYKQKNDIYKIKSLLNQKNKKIAFKKILSLKQKDFDENLYYLTINIFSKALININDLVLHAIKKVLKSNKFYVIQEIAEEYLKNLNNNEINRYYKSIQKNAIPAITAKESKGENESELAKSMCADDKNGSQESKDVCDVNIA